MEIDIETETEIAMEESGFKMTNEKQTGCGKEYYNEEYELDLTCGGTELSEYKWEGVGLDCPTEYEKNFCPECTNNQENGTSQRELDRPGCGKEYYCKIFDRSFNCGMMDKLFKKLHLCPECMGKSNHTPQFNLKEKSNYYDQENKDDPLDEDHEIDYSKDDQLTSKQEDLVLARENE